jgi:HEAT repeat protein
MKQKNVLWRIIHLSCSSLALCLVAGISWAQSQSTASPTFGSWKGFHPGDYVVTKVTFRGVTWRSDGVQFVKTVLKEVSAAGAGGYFDFKADQSDGPWIPGLGSHGDVPDGDPRLGATVQVVDLPPETIAVGANSFSCKVQKKTISDDWGTKTQMHWIDTVSDLEVQLQETYEGQDREGRPVHWVTSRRTIGVETRTIDGKQVSCLVQEWIQSTGGNRELRWEYVTAASVPGRMVAFKHWTKKGELPEVENMAVTWGHDRDLLDQIEKQDAELGIVSSEKLQQAQEAREEENRQAVDRSLQQQLTEVTSPDAGKRLSAVNCLSAWPIPDASLYAVVTALRGALADPDPAVRRRASWGLGQRNVKGLTEQILGLLRGDPDGAYQYIDALGLQGAPEGLPILVQFTSHTNQFLRKASVHALRNFKTEESLRALARAITDPYWEVRYEAIRSLEIVGGARSTAALVPALLDEDDNVARAAIGAIGKLGDDASLRPLLEMLSSSDEHRRYETCLSLGQMRLEDPRPAVDALLNSLGDPSGTVRVAAITSLGKLREVRAVPQLVTITLNPIGSANGPFGTPEIAAALALGRIGDQPALARLMEMLDDPRLEQVAFMAIAEAGELAAGPLVDRYIRTPVRSRNDKTMELLGKLGTRETVKSLSEYLPRSRPPEKASIRRALQQIEARLRL